MPQHGAFSDVRDAATYERHPVDDLEPLPESAWDDAGAALARLLLFATRKGVRGHTPKPSTIALRAGVAIWCLRPDLMPISLTQLARKLGYTKQAASKILRLFQAEFDWQARGARGRDSRNVMRRAMLQSHERRRSKKEPPPGALPDGGCEESDNVQHVQPSA